MNIKELLNLSGEQGKVVVVDEVGEVKGVFLSYQAYLALSGDEVETPVVESEAEKINRAILEAQLKEDLNLNIPQSAPQHAERLDTLLSKRAQQLFKSMPYKSERPLVDMRAEVIDPNYDFNAPEVTSEDEVIRPNFDDI